ncbi:FmdE family protein [Methanoregula sp.]|uniref:FmdE family protein n=1 Tax=Methanoregula sp. TaxID=2052170 RepID=UPI00263557BA|nr:FmdE family protein [Methanoregula sp.]MDD5142796.1 FmdE family protein [Methanoregula sp.]
MSLYETLFNKAKAFHGHVCPGIVLGTRLTIAGMRELGMDPLEPQRNLIVYIEIDRCGSDAVQAITGCSLGHRSLKHKDFGKFAAVFVDLETKKAVRVAVYEKKRAEHDKLDSKDVIRILGSCPEEEILKIEHVTIDIPENDIPGYPLGKAVCSICGELVMDNRHIIVDGKPVCKNCGTTSYYTVLEP